MHEKDDKNNQKGKEGESEKMNMTPQEIAREYREAKDKGNQIKILADENLTDRKEIIKILREQGEITDKVPRSKGMRAKATPSAAVSTKEEEEPSAAVDIPESVITACQRELVYMQQGIDRRKEAIEKMEENIKELKGQIAEDEKQMKEITAFCRG